MGAINSDVEIYDQYADAQLQGPRALLNSGTVRASEIRTLHQQYCPNAFIPKGDWREPTLEERKLLWATNPPNKSGAWVSLIRIPNEVLLPFEQLREATKREGEETLFSLKTSPNCIRGIEQVIQYITPLTVSPEHPFEGTGISIRPPQLITGTFNYSDGCFIGLHLDSWYRRPLSERHLSPNRICINLGQEDRFLLLINLSLLTMSSMLEIDDSADPNILIVAFMQHFSDYPVVKLRIAPKEAYIAPTENIIHDGSTLGQKHFDTCLTVRGQFNSKLQ